LYKIFIFIDASSTFESQASVNHFPAEPDATYCNLLQLIATFINKITFS
jgi:hypothetical protein